jgi:antitoxin VapB
MSFETIVLNNTSSSQSLKIPEELRINDRKVYLKKVGNALYIIPFNDPWASMFEGINSFTADFMEDREQPLNQIRESID